jgi:molybdate transport system substrate-binding protein
VAAALVLGLAGCGGADQSGGSADPTGTTGEPATLTVFAAASLKGVFEELGTQFEDDHPGVSVEFSFAGSSDLVSQIQQGAPADVFASADTKNMDKLVADDLLDGDPVDFATNTLTIAVPPGNPAGIASLADLTRDGLNVVVCAPQVPCGSATTKVEESSGITLTPVSEEQSVTDVLNKVIAGEADAGLVYVTDVKGAGDKVEGVPFDESSSAVNTYPIATVAGAAQPDLAQQFIALVTDTAGQDVLAAAGFAHP